MHIKLSTGYLERIRPRYKKASKLEKSRMLDEAEQVTELSRKHLSRLLSSKRRELHAPRAGRPPKYASKSLRGHLLRLWNLCERVSPARFHAAIPLWLPSYRQKFGPVSEEDLALLQSISASSIGRILAEHRRSNQKGKSTTRPNLKLKPQIPIKKLDERVKSPGTVQADTVAHCGSSLAGEFAWTLTMVDIDSGWTENRAIFKRDSMQIRDQIALIEERLPFHIKQFETDCGGEFLNYRVMNHLMDPANRRKLHRPVVQMRRARPYHKDDQCYVEQRNFTHVRNLFAYERIEDPSLVALMNDIYENYWNPLHNFFLPSMKLREKSRDGAKIKKKFHSPKTPAQRLIESTDLNSWRKRKLKSEFSKLNPVTLKLEMENKLDLFFKLLRESNTRRKAA